MAQEQTEKVVELTTDQKIEILARDIKELGRGVNVQAQLLESIVVAFDTVVKKYLELTRVVVPAKVVEPVKNDKRTKK